MNHSTEDTQLGVLEKLNKNGPEPSLTTVLNPLSRYRVEEIVIFLFKMAGAKGLEPSTFAVTGRRCNQLNYAPAIKNDICSS